MSTDETQSDDATWLPEPLLPYRVGNTIDIRRYHAPPPWYFEDDSTPKPRRKSGSFHHQSPKPAPDNVTEHTGTDSARPIESLDDRSLEDDDCLTITEELCVDYGRSAQIVVCQRRSSGGIVVAKFYDRLYTDDDCDYLALEPEGLHRDELEAQRSYSAEVAAYEHLNPSIGGTVIPAYYGSWMARFDEQASHGPVRRVVSLILMERVPGYSLVQVEDQGLTLRGKQFLEILARALHCDAVVHSAGVSHRDIAPRNIICDFDNLDKLDSADNSQPRTVLLDFDLSRVYDYVPRCLPQKRQRLDKDTPNHVEVPHTEVAPTRTKPKSPIWFWWYHTLNLDEFPKSWFPGMITDDYDIDLACWRAWLLAKFGNSPLYQAPPQYMSIENIHNTESI